MSGRSVSRGAREDAEPRSSDGVPHAPGALVWGVLTQLRHPTVLGLFLLSGLAAAATAFGLTDVGGIGDVARPLAAPLTLFAVAAWTVAYRHTDSILGADHGLRYEHLRVAVLKLPDLLLVYGTILLVLYATARASFWLFSGHYTPRFVFFLVALFVLLHTLLATPALLIGDAPSLASLHSSWELSRGIRVTLLGLWLFSTVVVVTQWLLLQELLRSYTPVQALVVFGVASGIFLGGLHLALVRVYVRAWAEQLA